MVHPSSVRQYTEWAFLQNRIRFTPAFEAEHLTTIVSMVEWVSAAALPEIAAGAVAQNGIVQRPLIGPVAERSIGLVTAQPQPVAGGDGAGAGPEGISGEAGALAALALRGQALIWHKRPARGARQAMAGGIILSALTN